MGAGSSLGEDDVHDGGGRDAGLVRREQT